MIKKFISELDKQGVSKSTIKGYSSDIAQFYEWLESKELSNQITKEVIYEYLQFLTNKYSEITALKKIKCVIKYNKFLYLNEQSSLKIELNEIIRIQKKKGDIKLLELNDLLKLREVILECNNKRDILIFHLIFEMGCRVSELINIKLDEIEITNSLQGSIQIQNNKSSNIHTFFKVNLREDLIRYINDYLEIRPITQNKILLIGQKGPLTRDAINMLFRKYSEMANIECKISPGMIRRFRISYLIKELSKNELFISSNIVQPAFNYYQINYYNKKFPDLN